jgi:Divergent InlB B-repeat domain
METPSPKRVVVAVALVAGLTLSAGSSPGGVNVVGRGGGSEPEANEIKVTVGGPGLVRSDVPNLIACGGDPVETACETTLTRGVVTLRATPLADSVFVKWTGAPGCGTSTACRIDVSAPRSIAATFRRESIPDGTSRLRVRVTGSLIGATVKVNGSVCSGTCDRVLPNRSTVTLEAGDVFFNRWSGSCVGAAGTCILVMSGPETTSASFHTFQEFHGVVRVTRTGPGSVESSPPGIVCGTGRNCSASFATEQQVTLKAETDSRHAPTWPGRACSGSTCSVKAVRGGTAVQVVFVIAMDELRVTRSGDGVGTVTSVPAGINCGAVCTSRFERGMRVTLRQEARTGSRFVGWSGACSGAGPCSVVPAANRTTTVTARFDRIRDELRVTKTGDGQGTVVSTPKGITCGGVCAAPFPRLSTVELRASPDGASRFAGWGGACSGSGVCSVRLERSTSVTARFDQIREEVRISKTGRGDGTITSSPAGIACGQDCSGLFRRGTELILRATPNAASRFAGWSGPCQGAVECRVTVRAPLSVEGRFTRICAAGTARAFSAKVVKGPRRVLVTIRLEGGVSARLRLFRARTKVAEKTVAGVGKGLRTLSLNVPRGARAGRYRFVLRLTDVCGGTRAFEKLVTVPRRA